MTTPPNTPTGVTYDDFLAIMSRHQYMFRPSGELWPAASVNARLKPVLLTDEAGEPLRNEEGDPVFLAANKWLDKHRAIEMMTWSPGHPALIQDMLVSDDGWIERPGCNTLNRYNAPTLALGEAKLADPWLDHICRIYPNDVDHILDYLAFKVQNPGVKINHALVLGGEPGIGKDSILYPVVAAIGAANFQDIKPAVLTGRFNGFMKTVLLQVSELRDTQGTTEVDPQAFYEAMKTVAAAPPNTVRIDEKNILEYRAFNVCGVVLTTNHKDGLFIPPDDRRYYVAWSDEPQDSFKGSSYFPDLYAFYESGGNGHVAAFLRTRDLRHFNPKATPPRTPAWEEIVSLNQAPEDGELADALDALGRPDAITVRTLLTVSGQALSNFLTDRRNHRKYPVRLEAAGYVSVRNPEAKDGAWKIDGKRQVVYVQKRLDPRRRLAVATMRSGHRGVFQRRSVPGGPRLPLHELHGPSIPHVFNKFAPLGLQRGEEALVTNLQHEFDYLLKDIRS